MFLNFKEFIDYCDNISSDQAEWVTLYEQTKIVSQEKKDDVFIMSAMVEDSEENRLKLFERIDWGFSTESFGKSTFYQYGNSNDNIVFKSGRTYEDFGLEYEYLVALRYFHGDYPTSVEINPELIWYGNLVKTEKGYLDSITDELKIIHEDSKITIHRDYLKDFFAAKNMIGVIVFDNRRFINSEEKINLENSEKRDSKLIYYVHKTIDDFSDYKYYSSIIGKIIIDAYQKPLHEDYRYFFPDEEEYVEFIIGVNQDSGEPIRYTCNDDELSNFFGKNPGSPHFLTPVFFSKDVLDRYTGNPAQYRVEDDNIVYLNIWSLPFTINKDANVSVWLGDLGRIPNKEQKYWSVYNIRPKGDFQKMIIRIIKIISNFIYNIFIKKTPIIFVTCQS